MSVCCLSHVYLKCKFHVWSAVYKQLDYCRFDKVLQVFHSLRVPCFYGFSSCFLNLSLYVSERMKEKWQERDMQI